MSHLLTPPLHSLLLSHPQSRLLPQPSLLKYVHTCMATNNCNVYHISMYTCVSNLTFAVIFPIDLMQLMSILDVTKHETDSGRKAGHYSTVLSG